MNSLFLMEFLLFDGAALVWAGWEMWSVRPGKDQAETTKKPSASHETPRHPER